MKEDKEQDEMTETQKPKEVTAYEDSWYRSLKALADMRPTEVEERPADADVFAPGVDGHHADGDGRSPDGDGRVAEAEFGPEADEEAVGAPED